MDGVKQMEDRVVAIARAKKEKLVRELERLELFLDVYDDLAQKENKGDLEWERERPQSAKVRPKNDVQGITDAAAEIIREAGRPLMRGDIVDRLEARGMKILSTDKAKYIGTILWRNQERFPNVEGVGYGLAGEVHHETSDIFD